MSLRLGLFSVLFFFWSCGVPETGPVPRPFPDLRPLDLQSDPNVRRQGEVLWAEREGVRVEVRYIAPEHLDSLIQNVPGGTELLQVLRMTEGDERGWWLAFRVVFVNNTGRRIYIVPGASFLIDMRYITQHRAITYEEIAALYYPRSGSAFGVERYRRIVRAASSVLLRKGFVEPGKGLGGILLFRFRGKEERDIALVLTGVDLSPDEEELHTADFRFDFSYTLHSR